MTAPLWALSLAYWLHMLATVLWVGGLTAISLLVLPAARKTLPPENYADFLLALQNRLSPLGWFSILVLLATGMLQMSAHPNYGGLLEIRGLWAGAILLKHLLFGGMVLLSAYLTWGLLPALGRAALLRASGKLPLEGVQSLQKREIWLRRSHLALGALILLLTAIARSA